VAALSRWGVVLGDPSAFVPWPGLMSPNGTGPATRLGAWLWRSKLANIVNAVFIACGVVLFVMAAADSVASWPSDRILMSQSDLERLAGFLLVPGWLWMMASLVAVYGVPQRGRSSRTILRVSPLRPLVIAFLLALRCVNNLGQCLGC